MQRSLADYNRPWRPGFIASCFGAFNNMATCQRDRTNTLRVLNNEIVSCFRCERLVAHRENIARVRRRAYSGQQYWGKPVPSFGDLAARLLIVGLAPGAHGANRTGRVFTGDRSGEFLYRALHETGFANQPESTSLDDGLILQDAFITCPVRCVPPENKPSREEIHACRSFLLRELELLPFVEVVVALGAVAFDAYLAILQDRQLIGRRTSFRFAHGEVLGTYEGGPYLLASYHPSQQNTSTGRLTAAMLRQIFDRARSLLKPAPHAVKMQHWQPLIKEA